MLRTNARTLLRSTMAYSINSLVGPLFTILITPIYTRVLGPTGLGVIEVATTVGMILSVVGSLGLATALGVLLHQQPDEHAQLRLISTTLWLGVSCSTVLALAAIAGARPLALLYLGDSRYAPELAIYLLNLPFGTLYALQSTALRLRQEAWRASGLALAQVVLLAALNLLLVVWLHGGPWSALAAQTLAYVLLSIVGMILAPRYLFSRPEWAQVRPLLLAGLPLVPAGLATWALGYIDRPLLIQMGVSVGAIGVYGLANKLVSMLAVLSLPFMSAWTPFALAIQRQPAAPRTYARSLTYYVTGMLGVALALSLFAHEALLVIGKFDFLPAEQYIWILAYVPIIQGSYGIITTGLYLTRKTPHLAWTTALGAAVNIGLNLVLVPRLGVLGAAIATPLGYICGPIAAYLVAQRSYPVPYELRRLAAALALQVILLALGLPLSTRTTAMTLGLRTLLLSAYPAALVLLGVVPRSDLALGWDWVRRRVRGPLPVSRS